jgi:hypothetical protein
MRDIKWHYVLFIALGIGAIVAIVYLVLHTSSILTRLTQRENKVIQSVD